MLLHYSSTVYFIFLSMLLPLLSFFFFFNDTATTEIYTLSLHDALPISCTGLALVPTSRSRNRLNSSSKPARKTGFELLRSEEHTSELQSPDHLVCRLLLEKKKKNKIIVYGTAE